MKAILSLLKNIFSYNPVENALRNARDVYELERIERDIMRNPGKYTF